MNERIHMKIIDMDETGQWLGSLAVVLLYSICKQYSSNCLDYDENALIVSIGKQQMIDLVHLNTDRLIHQINFNSNENTLYSIDLHNNGQWFAKACTRCENISRCLISSDGQITRLTLFPNQDNFIYVLSV